MNNTPQLRFPGFTGEWSEKKLGEVTNNEDSKRRPISKMNRNEGSFPYYGANGIQDYVDEYLFDGEYLLVGEDGSVINKDQTPVINWAAGKFWVNNHAHVLSEKRDYCLKYISLILSTIKIPGLVTGIPPKLNQENLSNISILLPSPAEQQKIADCLSALDDLISAQGEKVDALKTRKKGLMQQLFPQNGETTPRLRFPGFTGEWSIRKVSEIFKITRGYVLPAAETKEVPDEVYRYPVYSSQTAKNGLMGYYSKALYKDAITWTTDGANAGTVRYRNGEFYCTNVCGVLISTSGFANNCIAEILNTVSKNYVSYVGNPKLMNNVMSEIAICIPPTIKEQQKIASCLSALDDLIASESAELEALKAHKKGLMQQLFPEPAK